MGTSYLGCVTRKGPLCPESLSYQKEDGCAGSHPAFFWYDTEFWKIFKKKINLKSLCHTRRRMDGLPRTLGTVSRNAAHLCQRYRDVRGHMGHYLFMRSVASHLCLRTEALWAMCDVRGHMGHYLINKAMRLILADGVARSWDLLAAILAWGPKHCG